MNKRVGSAETIEFHEAGDNAQNAAVEILLRQKEPVPPYGTYSHAAMNHKLDILQACLTNKQIRFLKDDVAGTQDFIDRCFEDFEGHTSGHFPGSFGFVVPPRIRREVLGGHDEYVAEWEILCPILKHFTSGIAQRFLIGLPPFVVDTYGENSEGRKGYMLCAPMFGDMWNDMDGDTNPTAYYQTGKKIINDTLALARTLGIDTVGLGATLPRFLFIVNKLGDELDDTGLEITTGHAGTVWLMGETLKRLTEEGRKGINGSIAVLGAGSIGVAFIRHMRENLNYKDIITVYDSRPDELAKVLSLGYGNIMGAANEKELIKSSDTIVCAATSTLSLKKLGITKEDVDDKDFIDDSQPGCVNPNEVRGLGGRVVWVIGQDPTPDGELTRERFSYNGFGPIKRNEIWGCELESFLVRKYRQNNRKIGSLAVRRQVTCQNVRQLAEFAAHLRVRVADLQAQGEYLHAA